MTIFKDFVRGVMNVVCIESHHVERKLLIQAF